MARCSWWQGGGGARGAGVKVPPTVHCLHAMCKLAGIRGWQWGWDDTSQQATQEDPAARRHRGIRVMGSGGGRKC